MRINVKYSKTAQDSEMSVHRDAAIMLMFSPIMLFPNALYDYALDVLRLCSYFNTVTFHACKISIQKAFSAAID